MTNRRNLLLIVVFASVATASVVQGSFTFFHTIIERKNAHHKDSSRAPKQVFIDARKIYWGNIAELTKPESYLLSPQPVRKHVHSPSHAILVTAGNEALSQFTKTLRQALKAFEKKSGTKIVWRKNSLTIPDVTDQFINFFDKDFHLKKEDLKDFKEDSQ